MHQHFRLAGILFQISTLQIVHVTEISISMWVYETYFHFTNCTCDVNFGLWKNSILQNCTWDRNFDSNVSLWNSFLCYKLYMRLKFQSQCKLVPGLVTQSIAVLEAVPLNHSIQNCDPSFRVNKVNDGGGRVTSFLDLPRLQISCLSCFSLPTFSFPLLYVNCWNPNFMYKELWSKIQPHELGQ